MAAGAAAPVLRHAHGGWPSWLPGVLVLALALSGIVGLVRPALASADVPAPSAPVAISLVGDLSTAGLPEHDAVSRLVVRNDSRVAVAWAVRSATFGRAAGTVRIAAWVPGGQECRRPTRLLGPSDWSSTPLAPGAHADLCVRVSVSTPAPGDATPTVTVVARELV